LRHVAFFAHLLARRFIGFGIELLFRVLTPLVLEGDHFRDPKGRIGRVEDRHHPRASWRIGHQDRKPLDRTGADAREHLLGQHLDLVRRRASQHDNRDFDPPPRLSFQYQRGGVNLTGRGGRGHIDKEFDAAALRD
jgi:hypothetical protein